MPAQRTKAAVPPASRSAFAQLAGVPSWGAVLIAVTATLVGFAFEAGSGSQELGTAFALSYAVGCVIAALAVRASGIFTAVIQPPLLLFVAVPLSYFLLHRSTFSGLKDLLITCGYPLVERFPLMLFTTAAVLLVGLIRWYAAAGATGAQADRADRADQSDREDRDDPARTSGPGLLAGVVGRLAAFVRPAGETETESAAPGRRPRHGVDRSARASRPGRDGRRRREGSERTAPHRPRHARPVHAEADGPPLLGREGRREGRRWASGEDRREDRRDYRSPGRAAHAADGPPRRSRPRSAQRGPYEAPPERNGRRGDYRDEYYQPREQPREPHFPPRRQPDAGRREYYEPPPPYPPRNPPPYPPRYRPRPETPMDGRRGDGTHHPVSRVRYRGEPAQPPDRPDWSERRQPGRPRRDAGR